MRPWLLLSLLVLASCGGTLSDEQRKKLRDRMKEDEIKYISPGELTDAAFALGRSISSTLSSKDPGMVNQELMDSLEAALNVKIVSIQPGDSGVAGIEAQLIEAYMTSSGPSDITDNVQKLGTDSLLYTKPIVRERPDGSVEFARALSIHMPVKTVVMSIPEK